MSSAMSVTWPVRRWGLVRTVAALSNVPSQVVMGLSPLASGYLLDDVSLSFPFEVARFFPAGITIRHCGRAGSTIRGPSITTPRFEQGKPGRPREDSKRWFLTPTSQRVSRRPEASSQSRSVVDTAIVRVCRKTAVRAVSHLRGGGRRHIHVDATHAGGAYEPGAGAGPPYGYAASKGALVNRKRRIESKGRPGA